MSQRIEVILDDQGRLVLPSPLQRKLGLTPGMTLVVEGASEDAAYPRVQETEEPCRVYKQGVLVVRARPFGDLANVVRDERGDGARRICSRAVICNEAINYSPFTVVGASSVEGDALRRVRRLNELRALSEEELNARIQHMRQARNLPRLSYHFGQHGEAVGAGTPTEFNEKFGRHVARGDLRYFTFIRRIGDERMWYFLAEDWRSTMRPGKGPGPFSLRVT